MFGIDMDAAKKEFYDYIGTFPRNEERIVHKIRHSVRVSERSGELAEAMGLSEEDISLAELIGLIHDIGRFEQFMKYGTYVDRESEDHAELGNRLLFSQGLVGRFISDDCYNGIIEVAIGHHNAYVLPEGLAGRELLHCKIIRDADKLDNLYIKQFEPFRAMFDKEDISGEPITAAVLEEFLALRAIRHVDVRTDMDNWIKYIAFHFGMYFKESVRIAYDEGYADAMLDRVAGGGTLREEIERMQRALDSYFRARLE